jgi:hypothetical protein
MFKEFLERLFGDPVTAEVVIRTIGVLAPAEGARIMIAKVFKAEKLADRFGFLLNLLFGIGAAYLFYSGESLAITIYIGMSYGFGTIFVHWAWISYLSKPMLELLKMLPTWLLKRFSKKK